jgi:hypothetical protein
MALSANSPICRRIHLGVLRKNSIRDEITYHRPDID